MVAGGFLQLTVVVEPLHAISSLWLHPKICALTHRSGLAHWKLLRNSCSCMTVTSYFVHCWCCRSGVTLSRQYKLHYETDTCHTWSSVGPRFVGCIGVVFDATYTQKETDVCTEYDRSGNLLCVWWSESNCSGGQHTQGSWMSIIDHLLMIQQWALNVN